MPNSNMITVYQTGLLEVLLSAQAERTQTQGPDAAVTPEDAHRQLEYLYNTDPVFRSALVGLFKYVIDTLRVQHVRDQAVCQLAAWVQQDWSKREADYKERPSTG